MDYTLAKSLKDAGYPVEEADDVGIGHVPNLGARMGVNKSYWSGFSLSELIKAVESKENTWFSLRKVGDNMWCAGSAQLDHNSIQVVWIEKYGGKTPEEAVANYWLALIPK